jgi:hypothetical protein
MENWKNELPAIFDRFAPHRNGIRPGQTIRRN